MYKSILSATLLMASAMSWAQTREIVANPPTGSTVTSIESFTLTSLDAELPIIEVVDSESITITRDDAGTVEYGQIKVINYDDHISVRLTTPITTPGTYIISFPRGSVDMWDADYMNTFSAPAFSIAYIIEGTSQGGDDEPTPTPTTLPINADPADGTTLTSPLTSVTISSADTEFPFIDILSLEDIQVTFNDAPFCGVKATGGDESRTLTLKQTPTESGVYKLILPADAWKIFTYEPEYNSKTSKVELTYTIDLPGTKYDVEILPGKVNPNSVDAEPISLTTYDGALTKIYFDVVGEGHYVDPNEAARTATLSCARNGYSVSVPLRADAPKKKFACDTDFTTRFYLDLDPAVTQNGTYTLTVPKGALGNADYVNTGIGHANKEFTAELIFIDGQEEQAPTVKYDLDILGTKPAKGEITTDYQWEVTTVYTSADYRPREGAQVSLTCEKVGYNKTGELRFGYTSKYNGVAANILLFTNGVDPSKNGTYVLTIPQGTFGDAEWLANPDCGHSNPEIKVYYTISDRQGDITVAYDLAHSAITPADASEASIADAPLAISITVPAEVKALPGAVMTLKSDDAAYESTVTFQTESVVDGHTILTAAPTTAPTINGTYTLTIPQGVYGDADYIADCTTGHANAAAAITFTITGGEEPAAPVVFDLIPEVTPADKTTVALGELDTIVFIFPEGTYTTSYSARASMQCADANYYDTAYFTADAENPLEGKATFTLSYGTHPSRPGTYTIKVAEGTFSSADNAHQNPELHYSWTLNTSGISTIDADADAAGYYDLTGRYLGTDRTSLPAGLYIRKGEKILK